MPTRLRFRRRPRAAVPRVVLMATAIAVPACGQDVGPAPSPGVDAVGATSVDASAIATAASSVD